MFETNSALALPADEKGVVSLVDLNSFVTQRVKELTGGCQHPITDRGNIPSFTLAVRAAPRPATRPGKQGGF